MIDIYLPFLGILIFHFCFIFFSFYVFMVQIISDWKKVCEAKIHLSKLVPYLIEVFSWCVFVSLSRLIKHTKQLLEENEERLCIKVLQTLREMMTKDRGYGEKVWQLILIWLVLSQRWSYQLKHFSNISGLITLLKDLKETSQ